MKIVQRLFIVFLFFVLSLFANAQQHSSCPYRVSILTCAPGAELYSTFGHTAIRLIDSVKQTDVVFNWGTFDFGDPNFYMKFVRGKLEYFLSVSTYDDFIIEYKEEQRSIWEQELNLSCVEKQKVVDAMLDNLKAGKRFYKYDFLLDNCTSRVRDILFKNISNLSLTDSLTEEGVTYRNQIHEYLDEGAKPWSKLGIDILLGSKLDKQVTNWNAMFLPDYLMQGLDVSNLAQEGLIHPSTIIFKADPPDIKSWRYAPLLLLSIICAFFLAMSFLHNPKAVRAAKFFDSFLLYLTGMLGLLLLFMWFGTDHTVCKNNFNLLWALPTNIIAAWFLFKKAAWVKKYFLVMALLYGLLVLTWFWLPQQMNVALIPILLYLFIRTSRLAIGK